MHHDRQHAMRIGQLEQQPGGDPQPAITDRGPIHDTGWIGQGRQAGARFTLLDAAKDSQKDHPLR